MTLTIIIGVVIVVVLIFIIISSINGKKTQKKEQAKRKKVVKDEIKNYIYKTENRRNLRIEYDNVVARKGADYKYRDVFDVIISMYEPKTNALLEQRSYEIEGVTQKIDKKNFQTVWQVNQQTELDDTKRKVAIANKEVKLTKEEKKLVKKEEKRIELERRQNEREEIKKIKDLQKQKGKIDIDPEDSKKYEELVKKTAVKFIPKREK